MTKHLPFIKLLRSPISGYFYDVGKNEIIRVDDKVYDYLQRLLQGKETQVDCETLAIVDMLKERKYLSEVRPTIIEHSYTHYLQLFLDRKIEKITLQLTQQCNFRCKYCVYSENKNLKQRVHTSKRMTWKLAKKAIDFLWDHSVDSPRVNIGFYGGEPLLEFELMKKTVEYAKLRFKGKPISFTTTINGSLLTEKVAEFFVTNNISTLISLDGPKEIHDINRLFKDGSGTYDTVISNIRSICEKYPEYSKTFQISMVMDPVNDFDCINSVTLDCSYIDFTNINAAIVEKSDEPVEYSDVFSQHAEYNYFLALLSHFHYLSDDKVSPISKKSLIADLSNINRMLKQKTMTKSIAPGGQCIPGQIRLFVNSDGDLFPCERVNETNIMKIGSLETGFDYKKAKELLNIGSITPEECKNCWAIRHCTICIKMADDGDKLSPKTKISNCPKSINNVIHKLRTMILLHEIYQYY
ncbi:MAG: 4Fe-4S cluster-binding domain-containing protein [Crenarchaeota archaeon]|nr:4Fe-4S cluster-binding domain-containing protein [Thermoproteota archaeon]